MEEKLLRTEGWVCILRHETEDLDVGFAVAFVIRIIPFAFLFTDESSHRDLYELLLNAEHVFPLILHDEAQATVKGSQHTSKAEWKAM